MFKKDMTDRELEIVMNDLIGGFKRLVAAAERWTETMERMEKQIERFTNAAESIEVHGRPF